MYEERREKFSFRSFFLTILLVLLFVFLMLWLFPTKWDIKDLQSTHDLEELSVLYDEIFANNVARMKEAAIGYFTNERLPKKVGETKKLTLQEMYDLHLLLRIKDKEGNYCDSRKSYVEITKHDDEYRLKVNLSCGSQQDYIIVYLGCYDYCDGLCEKKVEVVTTKPTVTQKPTQTQTPQPTKQYQYEYKLVTDGQTTCGNWSNWTTNRLYETSTNKVESTTKQILVDYKNERVQTGTKKEVVKVGEKTEKFIVDYITELVVADTKKIPTGKFTTQTVTEKVQVGTVEKYAGIGSGSKVPANTDKVTYKNVTVDTSESCSYCENGVGYTWEIWNIEPVYDVKTTTKQVPVYKTINIYEEKKTPVYDFRVVDVTQIKETPVYETKRVPVYRTETHYRERTCTYKAGTTTVKWSNSNSDSSLINAGYKLTGNVKEV